MNAIPKKSLGQHWLHDTVALDAIVAAAEVEQGDYVLEIGPGLGTLTERLLEQGAKVMALEFDAELIPSLRQKFEKTYDTAHFWVEQADIRTYDFNTLPDEYKIVANIPYYLSANLLRLLTTPTTHKPSAASLLLQKEVTERVVAQPGQMAFMSVACQFYYEVSGGPMVPAELFTPPPKVNSQVLVLAKRPVPLFADVDVNAFFRLVKAGFGERRKTLRNSLSGGLRITKEEVEELLGRAGIDPQLRAQALSLDDWHRLYTKT